MIYLFFICSLLQTESYDIDYIKYNENLLEITVYIDSSKPDENLFKDLLEKKSAIELVNPEIFAILDKEGIQQHCKELDARLARIRKNFTIKIEFNSDSLWNCFW